MSDRTMYGEERRHDAGAGADDVTWQMIKLPRETAPIREPFGGAGYHFPSIWRETVYDPDYGTTRPLNPPG